jgi:hypothetical protein
MSEDKTLPTSCTHGGPHGLVLLRRNGLGIHKLQAQPNAGCRSCVPGARITRDPASLAGRNRRFIACSHSSLAPVPVTSPLTRRSGGCSRRTSLAVASMF